MTYDNIIKNWKPSNPRTRSSASFILTS